MHFKTFAAALFALFLAACNPMEQLDTGEAEIATFHETYNAGDARTLYGLTSEEFRAATSLDQMQVLVDTVSDRMGAVQSTERTGFNINTNEGETVSTITMTTRFEKGEGVETYTFMGTGDDMRLVGWHVDSPNFMTVPSEAVTVVEDAPQGEGEGETEPASAE